MKVLLCILTVEKQSNDKQDKNKGDAFFIRMSINKEVFQHKTRSQQQEYKEFLRRKNG